MRLLLIAVSMIGLVACGPTPETNEPTSQTAESTDTSAAEAVLDEFYDAAAAADYDRWIALFTTDARFYGTDATEDWPYEEFSVDVKEGFDAGRGWDFNVLDRRITLSPDGKTAWFAEISHFNTTDYTLRPTGVMIHTDEGWKISQLVMGVPFPNAIYDPMRMALQADKTGAEVETAAVAETLDRLHGYASTGALDEYFSLYTDDAMFFGTDETERWNMEEFRAYAAPAFADGEGWTYTPVSREIVLGPMKNLAWFDEVLSHERYSNTRGSGVLLRTDEGWKIAQYNLTFLVPNDVAGDVDKAIKGAETAPK
ncbi:nuclear transport factor 2 family protein [Parvularcula marina]|uniref:nuclear transport factor 2 family protein n=1 Tax=Parvularcula marina TaxID=2292771 RepID=UPI00351386A2